jgi:hypothetical protein
MGAKAHSTIVGAGSMHFVVCVPWGYTIFLFQAVAWDLQVARMPHFLNASYRDCSCCEKKQDHNIPSKVKPSAHLGHLILLNILYAFFLREQ